MKLRKSKRSIILSVFLFLTMLVTGAGALIWIDTSLESPVQVDQSRHTQDFGNIIKIGVIGDSWVTQMKLDSEIRQALKTRGVNAEVVSSGHPGAKSRQIYRNLVNPDRAVYSSNHIFMDDEMDFLVIIAGVNDSIGHVGADFYAHHIRCIIDAAIRRQMIPVLVELPEYGIEETRAKTVFSAAKRFTYLYLFDGGNVDVISQYRERLTQTLPDSVRKQILFIPFSDISTDFNADRHLYENSSHLNQAGNSKLAAAISASIADHLSSLVPSPNQ